MEFICRRCEFKTTFKQSLHRHLRNKTPCSTIKEDIPRETLLNQLMSKEYKNNNYKCLYCDRKFFHQSSQSRHMSKCPSCNPPNFASSPHTIYPCGHAEYNRSINLLTSEIRFIMASLSSGP